MMSMHTEGGVPVDPAPRNDLPPNADRTVIEIHGPVDDVPESLGDGGVPSVLVVDDTPGNRYTAGRVLRGAGMRVTEAETGAEALRFAKAQPDLIVLDIRLPDMTGYDVCQRLKADPETKFIPLMYLSASYTGSADRAYGLDAGADAYLTHPIDPPLFLATARASCAPDARSRPFGARRWNGGPRSTPSARRSFSSMKAGSLGVATAPAARWSAAIRGRSLGSRGRK